MRTAKSCGPDAPTLASSRRRKLRRRWWQPSPVTKESAKETVKTIAQGRPGVPANLWLYPCAFCCTGGCGCAKRPAFPAPSIFRGQKFLHSPGASRRGEADLCLSLTFARVMGSGVYRIHGRCRLAVAERCYSQFSKAVG